MADELKLLDVRKCLPTENNPRGPLNGKDAYLGELKASILARQEKGLPPLIHPILARPHPEKRECFEVLDGCCRLWAHQAASVPTIQAIVREMADEEAFKETILGHFRKDLTPLQEAAGLAAFFAKGYGAAEIAAELGRSESWVRRRARLCNLTKTARARALEGGWSIATCEALALLDAEAQDEIVGNETDYVCESSVARWAKDALSGLRSAPWPLDDATLSPADGACTDCQKRSDRLPGLFDEADEPALDDNLKQAKRARCLNRPCWERKLAAWVERRRAELAPEHPEMILATNDHNNPPAGARFLTDFEKAKKDAAGAVEVFVLDGDGAGELRWMVPAPWASENRRSLCKEEREKKTLAQKRERLAARRWAQVLEDLASLVENADIATLVPEKKRLAAIAGAAVFGTAGRFDGWDDKAKARWKEFEKLLAGPSDQPDAAESVATVALWAEVRPVLARRLTWNEPTTQTPSVLIEEAKRQAALLGIDLDALYADVAGRKGFGEPKAWGTEESKVQSPKSKVKKDSEPRAVSADRQAPASGSSTAEDAEERGGKKKRTAKSAKSAKKK